MWYTQGENIFLVSNALAYYRGKFVPKKPYSVGQRSPFSVLGRTNFFLESFFKNFLKKKIPRNNSIKLFLA
jgi:hypothetical protein